MVGEIEMKTKLSHVGAGASAGLSNTSLCEQNCSHSCDLLPYYTHLGKSNILSRVERKFRQDILGVPKRMVLLGFPTIFPRTN